MWVSLRYGFVCVWCVFIYSGYYFVFLRIDMSDMFYIFDVIGVNFEQLVIENLFYKLVLVDFWVDWCVLCKVLMLLLVQIVEFYQGELLLVKVNCDVEQDIVMCFGICSLLIVVLFKDGQLVDGFVGVQFELQICVLFEFYVKVLVLFDEDLLEVVQVLFVEGCIGDVEVILKVLLVENNENVVVLIFYVCCLVECGELEEVQVIFDVVKSDEYKQVLVGVCVQLIFLCQVVDLFDSVELKSCLVVDVGDDEVVYQLVVQQFVWQQYEVVLDGLFKLFLCNCGYQDDLLCKILVQVFDLFGNDYLLVIVYCCKLYQVFY